MDSYDLQAYVFAEKILVSIFVLLLGTLMLVLALNLNLHIVLSPTGNKGSTILTGISRKVSWKK